MNKTWLAIGILIVIGSLGFSEFHSINTKSKVQDDLREAEERLKNAKDTDSRGWEKFYA